MNALRATVIAAACLAGATAAYGQAGKYPANQFLGGPTNGSAALPKPRALVGADLPAPGASSLGGVESTTCATHQWLSTISIAGVPVCTQPSYSDLSGSATIDAGGASSITNGTNTDLLYQTSSGKVGVANVTYNSGTGAVINGNSSSGFFACGGSCGFKGTTFNSNTVLGLFENSVLASPNQAVPPVIDLSFNFPGYYWNGYNYAAEFARMDMDKYEQANVHILRSVNNQQQPGSIGFGGTWAANDIAKIQIVYGEGGSLALTIQCTVLGSGSAWTCGTGSGTTAISAILSYFGSTLHTNPMTLPIYFNGNGETTASTPSSGFTGFQYLTYWNVYCCTFNNQSTTSSGTFSSAGPVNNLDGPIGYFIQRDVAADAVFTASISGSVLTVSAMTSGSIRDSACLTSDAGANTCSAGISITNQATGTFGQAGTYNLSGSPGNSGSHTFSSWRVPQNNDNVGVFQFLGPTTASPAGGIPYAELTATIANSGTPLGLFQVSTFDSGTSGNGIARLSVQRGVSVGDSGGSFTDNGAATMTVPSAGAYYVGSTAGVSCSGTPTSSFASVKGIVTHC